MITLQSTCLDAYGHYRYRIDARKHVFTTSDADEVAAKLAELGVENPKHLVEHCRQWGIVEIHEAEEADEGVAQSAC